MRSGPQPFFFPCSFPETDVGVQWVAILVRVLSFPSPPLSRSSVFLSFPCPGSFSVYRNINYPSPALSLSTSTAFPPTNGSAVPFLFPGIFLLWSASPYFSSSTFTPAAGTSHAPASVSPSPSGDLPEHSKPTIRHVMLGLGVRSCLGSRFSDTF